MSFLTLLLSGVVAVGSLGLTMDGDRVEEAAGLRFSVPQEAMVTSQKAGEDVDIVAVSWGDEVLLITVYGGDARPKPRRAYEVHLTELERRVKDAGRIFRKDFTWKMLGKRRRGTELRYRFEGRWLVTHLLSAKAKRRTVVVVWTRPVGSGDSFAAQLLKGLRFK